MIRYRIIIFLFSISASVTVYSQSYITLSDSESNAPVSNAFLKILSDHWFYEVSNDAGKVIISADHYPIVVWISHISYAPVIDTIKTAGEITINLNRVTKPLEEVVITGQYEPQSAENSVYKVKSISKKEIVMRGATNLEQVLNTSLNIRIQNDQATGSTGLSMQGISGENIKVLIDGVPLTGRVGNQIDINQIDISQVEKIEIVEGPMAVNYGSNAMGGVINIITKKSFDTNWFITGSLNEESVGNEYGVDRGVHYQNISAGTRVSKNAFAQLSLSNRYFGGYQGTSEGRSATWDPKTQFLLSALVKYNPGKLKSFYKFDALREIIESKGEPSGIFQPIALDEEFETVRLIHQIQTNYPVSERGRLNALFAYTDYNRTKRQFVTDLTTNERLISKAVGSQDTTNFDTFNFRGSFINLTKSGTVSYEIGYDINLETGRGGRIVGTSGKSINDIGFYGSAEIIFNSITFRPGLRVAYNSLFTTPVVPSLNLKWKINDQFGLRAGYGRGFRAPSLKELYLDFVDASHRIFGNENLKPEDGGHFDLGVTYSLSNSTAIQMDLFYNNLTNQITFGQDPNDFTSTTYINLDKFSSIGINLSTKYSFDKLSGELGLGYIGRSGSLLSYNDSYLYSPEVTLNAAWQFNPKLNAGVYFKFTGSLPRYIISNNQGDDPVLQQTEGYSWLDLTSTYRISNKFLLTGGIKNVLDVTEINSGSNTGTHGSGTSVPVGYGRSYFIKLDFKLNSNKTKN